MIKLRFQSEISTQWVIHSSVGLRKKNRCHKNKGRSAWWASEKGARDRFSTQNQWQQWLLCQLVPHQFEKVKSAPGMRCLAWPHCWRSACTGPNHQTLQPALPAEQARASPHFTRLLAGGKSGSRWGVGLPTPKPPWEEGEVTPTGSNCQPASQRRGKRGDRGQEERGGTGEERRRMTRG